MKFLVLEALTSIGTIAGQHRVASVAFEAGAVLIDVDHHTNDDMGLRVGQSRYVTAPTNLDWSAGDPAAAATVWLASDAGPLSGATVHDMDAVEAARLEKAGAIMAAHVATIRAAQAAADDAIRQVNAATDLDALEAITVGGSNGG